MSTPLPPPTEPPARRTALALPRYRYVPGLNPHPFRHPDGHSYTDGSAPPEDAEQLPLLWLYGCDLFEHRFYWEAHEAWEACWHRAPPGPQRELLQGLIQAAAALLKRHMGHERAARRLLAAAEVRLQRAAALSGGRLDGVDIVATRAAIIDRFTDGGWPLLG